MFKNTATRRGTAIAAAALSLALVAPSVTPAYAQQTNPDTTKATTATTKGELKYTSTASVPVDSAIVLEPETSKDLKLADGNKLVYTIVDVNNVKGTKTEVAVNDGKITVTPKAGAAAGDKIEFKVKVEAKGEDARVVLRATESEKITVTVGEKLAAGELKYAKPQVVDGKMVFQPEASNLAQFPSDTVTYTVLAAEEGATAPGGVTVDDKGVVTVAVKAGVTEIKFKVKAEAKNAAGEVTRTTESEVQKIAVEVKETKGSLTYKDAKDATVAQKGELKLTVESKNLKKNDTDTVEFSVDGPATVKVDANGNVTVKPAEDAKVGDEIKFTVKAVATDAEKKVTRTTVSEQIVVKVVAAAPTSEAPTSEAPKPETTPTDASSKLTKECKEILPLAGIPLLALIPAGLLSQIALGSSANITNVINQQIRDFNAEIQRQAGILNPELAAAIESADKFLQAYGYSVASATVGLAALAGGIAASTVILERCLPGTTGGASLEGEVEVSKETKKVLDELKGSSQKLKGSSVKVEATPTPTAENK